MRSYISSFKWPVIFALALGYLTYRAFSVQFGYSPVPTESWFGDVAQLRNHMYALDREPRRPTIFIVAGSNGLFGIDSGLIEQRTGYRVENYSLHAGLHVDLLLGQVRNRVTAGDLVVAPMEWPGWNRTLGGRFDYSNYIHHFFGLTDLPIDRAYRLTASVPLSRWWQGLVSYIYAPAAQAGYYNRLPSELYARWQSQEGRPNHPYTHLAVNRNGDLLIDAEPTEGTLAYTFDVPALSDHGVALMSRWAEFFREKNAHFVVVPPVLLESTTPRLLNPGTWHQIEKYRLRMASAKTPLHCDPLDFVLPVKYRYNTAYHPNAAGAAKRSEALASCLNAMLAGEDATAKPINADEAVKAAAQRLQE